MSQQSDIGRKMGIHNPKEDKKFIDRMMSGKPLKDKMVRNTVVKGK